MTLSLLMTFAKRPEVAITDFRFDRHCSQGNYIMVEIKLVIFVSILTGFRARENVWCSLFYYPVIYYFTIFYRNVLSRDMGTLRTTGTDKMLKNLTIS